MDISWKSCWDCPIPMWAALAHFAVLAIVLALAGAIQRRRREPQTTFGWLLATVAFLWAAAVTSVMPNWGILKSELHFDIYPRSLTWIILCALDILLVLVFFAARRSSRIETLSTVQGTERRDGRRD